MRILTRYILGEILSHALIGCVIFTFILFMRELPRILEMVVHNSSTFGSVFQVVLFSLPNFFLITIPMAVLVGILLGLSRLAADSEIIAMRASGIHPRRQRLLDIVVGLTIAGYVVSVLADLTLGVSTDQRNGLSGAIAALSVAAPVIVVLRLLRHRTITSATLFGAIAAYLMLAVAYFFVFLTVSQWQGPESFFTTPDQPSSSFMYFSLTTITTVGYGDLTAQTHLGRLLATSEAVVGQVYLVTFVAMIVGLRAQEWRNRGDGRLDPPPDAVEQADA